MLTCDKSLYGFISTAVHVSMALINSLTASSRQLSALEKKAHALAPPGHA
jgi:hypothetical protein